MTGDPPTHIEEYETAWNDTTKTWCIVATARLAFASFPSKSEADAACALMNGWVTKARLTQR